MDTSVFNEFISLAINKSFTATANKLNMSHSSLSRHIISLEKEFGTQLIVRSNPITLTPAGKIVLERAANILAEIGGIRQDLKESCASISGQIRVMDIGQQPDTRSLISGVLLDMKKGYPGIQVSFVGTALNEDVIEAVRTKKLDIAFRYHFHRAYDNGTVEPSMEEIALPGLGCVALDKLLYRLCFGINNKHPLYGKQNITFAELAKHGFIQPAHKFFMDSNNTFESLCHSQNLSPHLQYIETDDLFSLWMMNNYAGALLLSETIDHNPLLPPEFFDYYQIVFPSDAKYYFKMLLVYRNETLEKAEAVIVAALEKSLGRPNNS